MTTIAGEKQMQSYIVLYFRDDLHAKGDPPFSFQCWADDPDHAEEQALNADPDGRVVWVSKTSSEEAAQQEYYKTLAGF